ncbi:MAG TPA: ComEC/Rec2 family competence protein [Actinospica sp.]|nr:ComEC/Rec2 family competence protein [Actinospica sp.]
MVKAHKSAPDLRLLAPVLAAWLATRLALTHAPTPTLTIAAATAALSIPTLCLAPRSSWLIPTSATLVVAAALAASAALHVYALRQGPVATLAEEHAHATVTAEVTGDPKPIKGIILLPVRIDSVASPGAPTQRVHSQATVLARPDTSGTWQTLLPSMHVQLTGRLIPPKDPAEGDAATLTVNQPPRVIGGPDLIQQFAGALRSDLHRAVTGLPPEPAAVLPALTLGDTSAVPAETTADLKAAGLSYLVVVSGENLVFLSAAVLPLARHAGLRTHALSAFAALLALGFTALARPGPPMVRATVTALLASVALSTGRRFRGLTATAGAALILLLIDPWLAHQYGFVLSVAATAGLLISAPGWRDKLNVVHRVPRWIATTAAYTAAAEIYCEPLLVTFTGSVPLYSVVSNVLAVPAAPPATVLGIAAMAGYAVWPSAGHAIAWLAQWPTRWICLVAHGVAHVPGAKAPWPNGMAGMFALLGTYAIGRAVTRSLHRIHERRSPA